MTNNINGRTYGTPATVPATQVLLGMLADSPDFAIVEDFHPGVAESITLVHHDTHSAVTFLIFESFEKPQEPEPGQTPWPLSRAAEGPLFSDPNHSQQVCKDLGEYCLCGCSDCTNHAHPITWADHIERKAERHGPSPE